MDAKEWRKVTERLKRNNRIQLGIGQFLMRKYLREARDRQAAGQNIHSQTLPKAGFNGGEQTQDCKGIAADLEKIRAHIDNTGRCSTSSQIVASSRSSSVLGGCAFVKQISL